MKVCPGIDKARIPFTPFPCPLCFPTSSTWSGILADTFKALMAFPKPHSCKLPAEPCGVSQVQMERAVNISQTSAEPGHSPSFLISTAGYILGSLFSFFSFFRDPDDGRLFTDIHHGKFSSGGCC